MKFKDRCLPPFAIAAMLGLAVATRHFLFDLVPKILGDTQHAQPAGIRSGLASAVGWKDHERLAQRKGRLLSNQKLGDE